MAPGSHCMSGNICGCSSVMDIYGSILRSSFLVRGCTPDGGVKGSTRNGQRDLKCPSARRLRMVREDTGAPNECATCAWMAANEAVGCMCFFLPMRRSSRQLICLGRPEPGLRANDISRIHWFQHLLTTQS
ncbi:uncharacterized protein TNCV_1706731 [Trichonephila clavipes]|uniref:Uncharacterized protein n=1 Tax=Trichonephila clavipes TaxID=2585209 RepID=A0A8X6RNH8_TRICX|nr:uncharacterized protein TNCV_1706731 [Trichonephila clavipes]